MGSSAGIWQGTCEGPVLILFIIHAALWMMEWHVCLFALISAGISARDAISTRAEISFLTRSGWFRSPQWLVMVPAVLSLRFASYLCPPFMLPLALVARHIDFATVAGHEARAGNEVRHWFSECGADAAAAAAHDRRVGSL